MEFALDVEQRGFARSLDDLLAAAGTPAVARAWADGDHDAGLKLWRRLADVGVTALTVPEPDGGLGATPVELAVAHESLGRHAVPGPWVEQAFLSALLPRVPGLAGWGQLARGIGAGTELLTVAAPPGTPYALDADVATRTLLLDDAGLHTARVGAPARSVDPTRRLFRVRAGQRIGAVPDDVRVDARATAALACAAELLGLGEALLAGSVDYVKQRRQFGRPIGEYQAVKHALADVRIGLDFARPLVYGAAVSHRSPTWARAVSAAKVKAADTAYRAARTALQVHGAIGYTAEHDLGLRLLKVRALMPAWGTPAEHRARILVDLVEEA